MSVRRNHTMAQRLWRRYRKLSFPELVEQTTIIGRDRSPVFFWRPTEVTFSIIGFDRYRGRLIPVIDTRTTPTAESMELGS